MDTSDVIAIVSIIVTGWLSLSVMRLTKRSTEATIKTTELTEKSVELSERAILLAEKNQELQDAERKRYEGILRNNYINDIYKKAKKMSEIIKSNSYSVIWQKLRREQLILETPIEEIAKYFSKKEIDNISLVWEGLEAVTDRFGGIYAFSKEEEQKRMQEITEILGIPLTALIFLLQDIKRNEVD